MRKDESPVLPPLVFQAPFAVLCTVSSEGYPDARAMFNLRNETMFPHLKPLYREDESPLAVYLTTNAASQKTAQIAADSRACLYFFDGAGFRGCALRGRIHVVNDPVFKRRAWIPDWKEYYPEGADSSDFTVLRFVAQRIEQYADLKTVVREFPHPLCEE